MKGMPTPLNKVEVEDMLLLSVDSDQTVSPEVSREARTPTGTCRRQLFLDAIDMQNEDNFSSHTNSLSETVEHLKKKIKTLTEQKLLDQKAGRSSAARRKFKKIKTIKSSIEKIEKGETLHPDFINSPQKSVQDSSQEKEDEVEVIDEERNKSNKNSQGKKSHSRKENYCIVCKKTVKEFCKHFENVHKDTVEGKQLNEINKTILDKTLRKKLKTEITDSLRKKGNAELTHSNTDFEVIPVKRSFKKNEDNWAQCAHCEGYYRRRKFSQHLRICKKFLKSQLTNCDDVEGYDALKKHALPVIKAVSGASSQLVQEVLSNMKNRETKLTAIKDPLIMAYASEFQKTRRAAFQKNYVSRVITDLARLLMKMKELVGEEITCLLDIFNPAHFGKLVECILAEGGYNSDTGSVSKCGLANRLRSHIKGAAETAKRLASETEYLESSLGKTSRSNRKMIKHFLELLKEKWANEVGRIFDEAVKVSRSENYKKLAAEEDISKTCQYICSQYRKTIKEVDNAQPGSAAKQDRYNYLLDLLITHIMCLIRRRPVDFKRGLNVHYEKLDQQEDLITEIKNSKYMAISDEDMKMCNKFKIFYIPGKGWKELVPIALTNLMKEAMDCIQRNKKDVGVLSDMLFVRAREMPVNPRECIRKVTKNLKLKKPLDMSANGLRHHAATWSKLHSSHPQYQDYLASALGHTLHIHKLHYEMPTSILQKLIVCPVLENMTTSSSANITNAVEENDMTKSCESIDANIDNLVPLEASQHEDIVLQSAFHSPEIPPTNLVQNTINSSDDSGPEDVLFKQVKSINRYRWTHEEKKVIYGAFGKNILEKDMPPRRDIVKMIENNGDLFKIRSVSGVVSFINNKIFRKQKNVTPEVKKYYKPNNTHRKMTNVPI